MEIKTANEDDDQKLRADLSTEETSGDAQQEEFEQDMKLARRIMRDNRIALSTLADAFPAVQHPQAAILGRMVQAEGNLQLDCRQSPDLRDEAVRRRLGPTGLTGFRSIMEIWGATGEEARQLLGLAEGTSLDDLDPERLSEEQMVRISYLIGIYKALHTYLGDEVADRWISLENGDARFGERRPLSYMAEGGVDALREVRGMLDAWCAGN